MGGEDGCEGRFESTIVTNIGQGHLTLILVREMSKKRKGISETSGCGNQLLEKTYVLVCYCYV